MATLFDDATFAATLGRLEALTASAPRQWGKMTPAQALEHTARALEMSLGRGPQKQMWLGKLIGWMVRKDFVGPKPFGKNGPTSPDFIVKDDPAFDAARARLLALLHDFRRLGESGVEGHVHAFFGRMSGAEWGVTQWKHIDHHLRQFGA